MKNLRKYIRGFVLSMREDVGYLVTAEGYAPTRARLFVFGITALDLWFRLICVIRDHDRYVVSCDAENGHDVQGCRRCGMHLDLWW